MLVALRSKDCDQPLLGLTVHEQAQNKNENAERRTATLLPLPLLQRGVPVPDRTPMKLATCLLGVAMLVAIVITSGATAAPAPPPIVLFFADNLGWGDIGAFGAPNSKTPAIDALAAEGTKLLSWYSAAAVCSPSRAALLTGRLAPRTGVYPMTFHATAANGVPLGERTLAEALRAAGYSTMMIGKWHLGQRAKYLPTARGFEHYLGVPYSMDMGSLDWNVCEPPPSQAGGLPWLPLLRDAKVVKQPLNTSSLVRQYATAAEDFLSEQNTTSNPFLLYVAFSHNHQLCATATGGLPQQVRTTLLLLLLPLLLMLLLMLTRLSFLYSGRRI